MNANVFPAIRYQDAQKAIQWLCDNLGFSVKVIYADGEDVKHAQLTYENGLIMISSFSDNAYDKLLKGTSDLAKTYMQSTYIYVSDLESHHDRVREKDVEIVLPLTHEEHGSGYTCRDPEGHLWSFGDYNPWID